MAQVGRKRFIHFRIADINGTPVLTRVLSDFVKTFHRDGLACADELTLEHESGGLYCLTYTPSSAGQDYLELYDPEHDLRIADDEYVASTEELIAYLTQDTGGVGALKADVAKPETFTLYVFLSEVWQSGDCDPLSAVAFTQLDPNGNWLTAPLPVLRDTYHIVLLNRAGETHVLRPFLDLKDGIEAPPFPVVSGGGGDTITIEP